MSIDNKGPNNSNRQTGQSQDAVRNEKDDLKNRQKSPARAQQNSVDMQQIEGQQPEIPKVDLAMRRAALLESCVSRLGWRGRTFIGVTAISLCLILSEGANAQAQETQRSRLAPPVNHETGRIEEVLTASDDGFHFRGYVLTWRSMRIVVAVAPGDSHVPGDNLDVVVYRSDLNGRKVLRFESKPSASNVNATDVDSAASSASIILGTARIEDTVSADSDGYRFVGYFVTWHDERVFVVDPQSAPMHAMGETINFRVFRTGGDANKQISFSL
jgi:hypothetical protein